MSDPEKRSPTSTSLQKTITSLRAASTKHHCTIQSRDHHGMTEYREHDYNQVPEAYKREIDKTLTYMEKAQRLLMEQANPTQDPAISHFGVHPIPQGNRVDIHFQDETYRYIVHCVTGDGRNVFFAMQRFIPNLPGVSDVGLTHNVQTHRPGDYLDFMVSTQL